VSARGRLAIGLSYRGTGYHGWQSQADGNTVQDQVERALSRFADAAIHVVCAGRTDAGVHAINQVLHIETDIERDAYAWLRGTNRYLPADIALQWARPVGDDFHARNSAHGRRYSYWVLQSPTRPSLETGAVGWVFRPLDETAMRAAAQHLIGEHDFSAFRSADCQAATPVKALRSIEITRRGAYWRFDFDASAFLHHMVRNIMGCLILIGSGRRPSAWMADVLAARDRAAAAPTFAPDGLYFVSPYYDARHGVPTRAPASDWLP